MSAATVARLSAQYAVVADERRALVARVVRDTPVRLERLRLALAERVAAAHAVARLSPSVLVVDDRHDHAEALALYLRSTLDVPVHVARTAAEGRALWYRERPAVAVIDLDLGASEGGGDGGDGDDLAGRLPRAVRVLLLSGADETTLRRAAAAVGATPVRKGDPPADLAALVLAALAHATPL